MAKLEDVLITLEIEAKAKFPNLDLQDGSVEKDIFLRAPALLVDNEDKVQTYIRRTTTPASFRNLLDDDAFISDSLPSVFGVNTEDRAREILSDEVDTYAANWGVSRREGTRATGTVTLFFDSSDPQTIVAGFGVSTSSTPSTRFVVSRSFIGSPTADGDLFSLTVGIQSVSVGQDGNVPQNNITVADSSLPGLVAVNNQEDTSGGVDIETDESVLDRVIVAFQGSSIDTVEGVKTVVLNAGAFDAEVFRIGDAETDNRPGPDVIVVDETLTIETDSFTWESVNAAGYVPEFQPISEDPGLISIPGHPDAQFLVIKDPSVNGRSSRAQDRIIVYGPETPTGVPTVGESISLSYGAYTEISNYQALFEAPNDELFFDVLVKQAIRLDIAISMNVVLFSGIDPTGVTPQIEDAVLSLVNNLGIGDELNQSDVIAAVEAISGVNRVNLPLNFFGEADSVNRVVENTITPSTEEYLRLSSSNLTLSVL
jgi:uncharacterized phage protein gp47/JayE